MSTPHRCPICWGKGIVPPGFYSSVGVEGPLSTSTSPEPCRSCGGNGIVWDYTNYNPFPTLFTPLPNGGIFEPLDPHYFNNLKHHDLTPPLPTHDCDCDCGECSDSD